MCHQALLDESAGLQRYMGRGILTSLLKFTDSFRDHYIILVLYLLSLLGNIHQVKMEIIFVVVMIVSLAGVQPSSGFSFDEDAKRHYIYWDSKITEIIKDPTFSLQVEMGQFMDIVCPLSMGMSDDDLSPPVVFDLYNVTEDGFRTCDPTGGRLIFACSLPDQENKLTIKFQSISPSPFGFRFQKCAEYYFLAVKRPSPLKTGKGIAKYQCTEESERLRIHVGCSHEKKNEVITTTVPTTIRQTTTSIYDRVKSEAEKKQEEVAVPDIKPVSKKPDRNNGKVSPRSDRQQGNGAGNGAPRTAHFDFFSTVFCAVLSIVCFSIHSTSL